LKELSDFSKLSAVMTPQGNFVCLKILDPGITSTQLCQRLLERGVIIKDCSVSYQGLGDRFVRVDVSLRAKMVVLLQQLTEICR
jgi:histidinol-phosphate aminotransferase